MNWIRPDRPFMGSYVIAYKRTFELSENETLRVHVSADQRYRLFVDGVLEGEGPSRGDQHTWYYESYDLDLEAGPHSIVALVWSLDPVEGIMPAAQITIQHGFLLAADAPHTELVSTGCAAWEFKQVDGIAFAESGMEGAGNLAGGVMCVDGNLYPWGVEEGSGAGWSTALNGPMARSRLSNHNWGCVDDHILTPTPLEPPFSKQHDLTCLRAAGPLQGDPGENTFKVEPANSLSSLESLKTAFSGREAVTVKANQRQWLLFDLDNYYCGYPELRVEHGAGSTIRVLWAESLYQDDPGTERFPMKGHRDAVDGKVFFGRGDTFLVGATGHEVTFTSFWWSSGRYIALQVETGDEDLVIHRAGLRESRYPLELVAGIELSSESFMRSRTMMWRTLQMCAHETYMDCPYYEQINYTGDTRVQALASYVASGEFNLPRKCIQHFNNSLLPIGLTQSRFPCSIRQVIPQFSLYWICMVYDYAKWKGDPGFVRRLLPNIHCVLDTFLQHLGEDGLLHCPDGWDWVDWVDSWETPRGNRNPIGRDGVSAVNHMQLIYTLGMAEGLENWAGQPVHADYYRSVADALWENGRKAFWDEDKGLFAATTDFDSYNAHTQCFAALCRQCDEKTITSIRASLESPVDELVRPTFYFQFYLFAAYARLGLSHKIVEHFDDWGKMMDMGCRTTLEKFDPARSDCHAWSAHPLYHAAVSIGGIRPLEFGFEKALLAPAVRSLDSARIEVPHHKGSISVNWRREAGRISLEVGLPDDLDAVLLLDGKEIPLNGGPHRFDVQPEAPGKLPVPVPPLTGLLQ